MLSMGSTFERYADGAKSAIFLAHIEAIHRREKSISVGDLLVGLTHNSESRACKIAPLKEQAVMLRAFVGIPHLPSTPLPYQPGPEIPLDNDAKKALAYALEEADRDRQYWIDSDHLLRGVLRFPNNAAEALLSANVHLDWLRSASVQNRKESPSAPTPKLDGLRRALSKYWAAALVGGILLAILAYLRSQG
jgi:hypothetical protein